MTSKKMIALVLTIVQVSLNFQIAHAELTTEQRLERISLSNRIDELTREKNQFIAKNSKIASYVATYEEIQANSVELEKNWYARSTSTEAKKLEEAMVGTAVFTVALTSVMMLFGEAKAGWLGAGTLTLAAIVMIGVSPRVIESILDDKIEIIEEIESSDPEISRKKYENLKEQLRKIQDSEQLASLQAELSQAKEKLKQMNQQP